MIDGKNLFDQPVRNDIRMYKNIWDDCTTGCLIHYLKNNYNK